MHARRVDSSTLVFSLRRSQEFRVSVEPMCVWCHGSYTSDKCDHICRKVVGLLWVVGFGVLELGVTLVYLSDRNLGRPTYCPKWKKVEFRIGKLRGWHVPCLLWIDKTRATEKTNIWVSVWWKTKTKTEGSTHLTYTGLFGGLEHLKIETRSGLFIINR